MVRAGAGDVVPVDASVLGNAAVPGKASHTWSCCGCCVNNWLRLWEGYLPVRVYKVHFSPELELLCCRWGRLSNVTSRLPWWPGLACQPTAVVLSKAKRGEEHWPRCQGDLSQVWPQQPPHHTCPLSCSGTGEESLGLPLDNAQLGRSVSLWVGLSSAASCLLLLSKWARCRKWACLSEAQIDLFV